MHSRGRVVLGATSAHGSFEENALRPLHTLPSLRCQVSLEKDFAEPESHKTPVRKSFDGAIVDGGLKPNGNREVSGCDEKSLVERLNQTVSIHPDMANAPTHCNPGNHGSPSPKAQKLEHLRSPPHPTENDPSRADLRGQ